MAVFRKAKMMVRIEKAGMTKLVDAQSLEIMNKLDGKPASASCWERVVNGRPVLWVAEKSLPNGGAYVHEDDCE